MINDLVKKSDFFTGVELNGQVKSFNKNKLMQYQNYFIS